MAIGPASAIGMGSIAGAGARPTGAPEAFSKVMQGATPQHTHTAQAISQTALGGVSVATAPGQVSATVATSGATSVRSTPAAQKITDALDRVSSAQKRMDDVLALAQSGKSFSPAELLALQSQVYRASQEIDLAGKVVEKATGGIKQVLQTQL